MSHIQDRKTSPTFPQTKHNFHNFTFTNKPFSIILYVRKLNSTPLSIMSLTSSLILLNPYIHFPFTVWLMSKISLILNGFIASLQSI